MNATIYAAQTATITAVRLFLLSEATRLQPESAAGAAVCQTLAAQLLELEDLDTAPEVYTYKQMYEIRDAATAGVLRQYDSLSHCLQQDRLRSLQFNGMEIDTELIRIFLFGQNLVAMPNP